MTLPKGTAVIALATMAAVTITASSSPVTRLQFSSQASPPADAPTIVGVANPGKTVTVKRVKWRRFPGFGVCSRFTKAARLRASDWPWSDSALRSPGHGLWRREPGCRIQRVHALSV